MQDRAHKGKGEFGTARRGVTQTGTGARDGAMRFGTMAVWKSIRIFCWRRAPSADVCCRDGCWWAFLPAAPRRGRAVRGGGPNGAGAQEGGGRVGAGGGRSGGTASPGARHSRDTIARHSSGRRCRSARRNQRRRWPPAGGLGGGFGFQL